MSGWTNVTMLAQDDEDTDAIEARLSDEWERRSSGYADNTVVERRGIDHEVAAQQWANHFPEADRILVISANDTSDSGTGTLFTVEDGEVEQVAEKAGYAGANGKDVVGYFREEHDAKGYASWEAGGRM